MFDKKDPICILIWLTLFYTNEGSFFMFHNKYILSFVTVFLIHNSAHAMKRPLENGTLVVPKRQKLVCPKTTELVLVRHEGMFYCQIDTDCSYVTKSIQKINDHHELHNDHTAIACTKCDYLGTNQRSLTNHISAWHKPLRSSNKKQMEENVKKPTVAICGYCGREGNNMKRHMETYHTPRLGRSHNQCFPLVLPKREKDIISISSDSQSGSELSSES